MARWQFPFGLSTELLNIWSSQWGTRPILVHCGTNYSAEGCENTFFGRDDKLPTFGRYFCSSVCMFLRSFLPSLSSFSDFLLCSIFISMSSRRDADASNRTFILNIHVVSNIATESPTFCNSVSFSITFPRPRGVGTKWELATYLRRVSIVGEVPFRELCL